MLELQLENTLKENTNELIKENENKKVILRHLKVIEELNSNVCFKQLKILQKTKMI